MWMLRRCLCIWLYSEDFWSAACNRGISQTRFEISLCSTLFAERCWDLFNPFSTGRVRRIGSTLTSTCGSCQVGIPALKHGTVSKVFESFANASEGLREVTQNGKKGMTHVNELKQGSNYWMLKCSKMFEVLRVLLRAVKSYYSKWLSSCVQYMFLLFAFLASSDFDRCHLLWLYSQICSLAVKKSTCTLHEAVVPSCPILPRPLWGLSSLRWCEACQGYSHECQDQDQERCASLHLWVRRKQSNKGNVVICSNVVGTEWQFGQFGWQRNCTIGTVA